MILKVWKYTQKLLVNYLISFIGKERGIGRERRIGRKRGIGRARGTGRKKNDRK